MYASAAAILLFGCTGIVIMQEYVSACRNVLTATFPPTCVYLCWRGKFSYFCALDLNFPVAPFPVVQFEPKWCVYLHCYVYTKEQFNITGFMLFLQHHS